MIHLKLHWFGCPKGNFVGTLVHVKESTFKKDGVPVKAIKLIFEIDVPSASRRYLAARTLEASLDSNSQLSKTLRYWFGENYAEVLGQKDQFNFACLDQKKAEVTVANYPNPGHDLPYAPVVGIYPLGSLKLTTQVSAG